MSVIVLLDVSVETAACVCVSVVFMLLAVCIVINDSI